MAYKLTEGDFDDFMNYYRCLFVGFLLRRYYDGQRKQTPRDKRCFMKLSRFIFLCLPFAHPSVALAAQIDGGYQFYVRSYCQTVFALIRIYSRINRRPGALREELLSREQRRFPGVVSLVVARKDLLHVFCNRLPLLIVIRWFRLRSSKRPAYSFTLLRLMIQIFR